MADTSKAEDDIHKPFSIKMDDHARQEKLMQFLRRQNKMFNYGLMVGGEVRPPTTGPILGGPDLTLLIRGDRLAVHSLLFWFHCRDFAQWLRKHRCMSLPALVDLRDTELTYQAMRNIVDWVYEEDKDILLDMASAVETMYAAAYFGVDALLKIVQDYSLQVSLRKPKILLKWLTVADKFECDSLYKNELYHMAATYFQSLLKVDRSEIGHLSSSALIDLLRREDLNVLTEIDTFKMALIWIKINKGQTEKRAEVDSILQSIRFVTMSLKDRQLCLKLASDEDPEILDLLKPHIMLADWHQTCKSNDRPQESDLKEQLRKHVLTGVLASTDGSSNVSKSGTIPVHMPLSSPEYPPADLEFGTNSGIGSLALPEPDSSREAKIPTGSVESTTNEAYDTKIEYPDSLAAGPFTTTQQEETAATMDPKGKETEKKNEQRGLPSLQDAEELRRKRQQSLDDMNRVRKSHIKSDTPDQQRVIGETQISIEDYGRHSLKSKSSPAKTMVGEMTAASDSASKAKTTDTPMRPLTSTPLIHQRDVSVDDQLKAESSLIANASRADMKQQQRTGIIDSGHPVCFHFETTETQIDPQGKKSFSTFKYDFKNPDSTTTTDTSKDCKHKQLWKIPPSKRG